MRKLSIEERMTSQETAREIMRRNMFGIEEAIQHIGVNPSRQQVAALSKIRWFSEATLEACRESHVLVTVFPISIIEISQKVGGSLICGHADLQKAFLWNRGNTNWQLIRKTPVEGSISEMWHDQQALLMENEETPTARIMTYMIIGHYLATGERLFENMLVRCSDMGSNGYHRVTVGNFSEWLYVDDDWDGGRHDFIGVASARKFD